MHLHHIDGNPYNNSIDNLLICTPKEHWNIHKKQGDPVALNGKFVQGADNFLGKKHTLESRKKISEGRLGIEPWNKGKKCSYISESRTGKDNPMFGKDPHYKMTKEEKLLVNKKRALSRGSLNFNAYHDNVLVNSYVSKSRCEKETGVKRRIIRKILNGEQKSTRDGWTFEYYNP